MNTAISKVERGASWSVDWHIENWNIDLPVLKDFASCTMIITDETKERAPSNIVEIRFFFKENPLDPSLGAPGGCGISVYGELVSGGNLPMVIFVDIETPTNPMLGFAFKNKICSVDEYRKPFTLGENFIRQTIKSHNSTLYHYDTNYKELNYKITATVLNINKNESLTESEKGAVGIDSFVQSALANDVKLMYKAEENYSDLNIETKDNMTLSGHRFILAARSPGFRKLIDEQMKKEDFSGVVKFSTVNAKPLVVILHWMYTGELHNNAEKVMEEVMEVCVAFEIPALLKILDKMLISICNTNNMFRLFQAAQQHGLINAKEAISEYIKENIGTT